jgi:hypothetical protein
VDDLAKGKTFNTGKGRIVNNIEFYFALLWTQRTFYNNDINSVAIINNENNWAFMAIEDLEEIGNL